MAPSPMVPELKVMAPFTSLYSIVKIYHTPGVYLSLRIVLYEILDEYSIPLTFAKLRYTIVGNLDHCNPLIFKGNLHFRYNPI